MVMGSSLESRGSVCIGRLSEITASVLLGVDESGAHQLYLGFQSE